jgi:hydroxybutyrate-dimer hydrolase
VCGFSLANVNATGDVAPQVPATQATLFGTSNGLNTGADVIYNDSVGGAKLYHLGVSPSTSRVDASLDGMLCMRDLVTGVDTVSGAPLTGAALVNSNRVRAGVEEVLLSGNLRGRPAVIVHGRNDALVPVNHSSRPYVAFNSRVEGTQSNLRYYEVVNGNHFDAFLPNLAGGGVQGFDTLFVPLHVYFNQAMNLMWERLRNNVALPPSQVVRAVPRGGTAGSAPELTSANVPPISASPAAGNVIGTSAGTINVPN